MVDFLRKEAIGTADSIEKAIDEAKKNLCAPETADVMVEVIEAPKKKTFGLFGGSPAKVKAYYEAPDEKKDKQANKTQPKKETVKPKEQSPKPAVHNKPAVKQSPAENKADIEQSQPSQNFSGPTTDLGKAAHDYISSIVSGMGVDDIAININETDDEISANIDCGNGYGFIIGRRGETLDALQYLTRLVINKGNENYKRVSINAGNYREKREDTLKELAVKQAARAKKYGRNVCLDPMNPYERRIIHTTIQEIEGVSSHSVGSENERRVIITSNDASGRHSAPYRSDRSHKRNDAPKYNSASSTDAVSRAPRSDFEGGSRYGKIEPKNQ